MEQSLQLNSDYAQSFDDYLSSPKQVDNLFVITHLGQLKQMETLIHKKQLRSNGLAVLYTRANFIVPQTVHDKVNPSLFEFAIFIEIPLKINQANYFKLSKIYDIYSSLMTASSPQCLYLNSFEGHYAILIALASKQNVKKALVEEGTATYKLASSNPVPVEKQGLDYQFFKDKFMQTIGQAEMFKRLVKQKKYTKDLFVKSKQFYESVVLDEKIQSIIIDLLGKDAIKAHKKPFLEFDEIYASFPDLIQKSFDADHVYAFNIYEAIDDETMSLAKEVVEVYDITSQDALYISQRYMMDPTQYVNTLIPALLAITESNRRVFIKLHPKESNKVYKAFQKLVKAFPDKLFLIEDNRFLVEPVIKASNIQKVIGLTSTTLVYAPLISKNTQSISIAQYLIDNLPKTEQNLVGCKVIQEHLEILKTFNNIDFYGEVDL